MWSILETLYDLTYFIIKNMEGLKWEALLFYLFYLFGKRSGMKMFRKFLQNHFPLFKEESEEWRKYVGKQIVKLGGEPYIPVREYGRSTLSEKSEARNLTTSSTLSQEGIDPERRHLMTEKIYDVLGDPGHGGHDTGAISVTGVKEKDINLAVGLKVKELLKDNPRIRFTLTRETDVFVQLSDRAKMANKMKAEAFISIHVNSFKPESTGTETEYTRTGDSVKLATILQKHLVQATGFKDRGINKLNLAVTRETKMAAALAEPGFLSNPAEEVILVSPDFIPRYAEAVARAACEYLGVPYNTTVGVTQPVTVCIGDLNLSTPGIIIDGRSWVPAKMTLSALGFMTWYFQDKTVHINSTPVETKIFDNTSYIRSVDLMSLGMVRSVFMEPDATNPKRVLIIPKEG
ncbi:N-acetylmuramoyl-L-alanine amidase family protein [Paenibacillus jilunlii]|uniref:N-acetylmuramoyl-L-alanine amidase n=1 Tax=Paenibacillus jilunlii TaxID=682956 RepID=A0A1H0AC16_9BACL|nr:N-acetylmuramoyl-L-alanine amidase [Paenibacillus jilunlii]SDN31119.1 N-acetylmuramoyl-L-alanine amidase [Paenibacillus jilunlii]